MEIAHNKETHEDWRLSIQLQYLHGVQLYRRPYTRLHRWDQDQCEFCAKKFAEASAGIAASQGYTTEDSHHWICEKCHGDFRQIFEWE